MSRARRLPRHRHTPTITKAAVPVAIGGAVAAVTLSASPLADALHRHGSTSGDGQPDVVMVAPATATAGGSGERVAPGDARPVPGSPASAAPHIRVGSPGGTGGTSGGGSVAPAQHAQGGGTGSTDPAPTAEPASTTESPNGNGSPPTAPPGQDPTHKVPVPLPTLSTTSLPTLLPTLTTPPLP